MPIIAIGARAGRAWASTPQYLTLWSVDCVISISTTDSEDSGGSGLCGSTSMTTS